MEEIKLKPDHMYLFKGGIAVYLNDIKIDDESYLRDTVMIDITVANGVNKYGLKSIFNFKEKEHYFVFNNKRYYMMHRNPDSLGDSYYYKVFDNTEYNRNATSAKYIVDKLYEIFEDKDCINKNIISIDFKDRKFTIRKEFREILEERFVKKAEEYITSIRNKAQVMNNIEFIDFMYDQYKRGGHTTNIKRFIKTIKKDRLTFLNLGNYIEFIIGDINDAFCTYDIY